MPTVKNTASTKAEPKCSSSYAKDTPVTDIISTDYQFPFADSMQPGDYITKISDIVDSKTANKKRSIDVLYDAEDSDGEVYNFRLRYPIHSSHIKVLTKNLMAEGFVKTRLAEAVGATEVITLTYKDEESMGEITARSRYKAASAGKATLGSRHKKNTQSPVPVSLLDDEDEEDLIDDIDDEDLTDFLEEDED